MLGLIETMDHLTMAGNVHWHGHVLRREDGHVFGKDLGIKVGRSKEDIQLNG